MTLPTTADLVQQIDSGGNFDDVRRNILALISAQLHARNNLGIWERAFFAGAISALNMNLDAPNQPTRAWLRLSLTNLAKALVPADQRNEAYTGPPSVEPPTYEDLCRAVEYVAGRAGVSDFRP